MVAHKSKALGSSAVQVSKRRTYEMVQLLLVEVHEPSAGACKVVESVKHLIYDYSIFTPRRTYARVTRKTKSIYSTPATANYAHELHQIPANIYQPHHAEAHLQFIHFRLRFPLSNSFSLFITESSSPLSPCVVLCVS